MSQLQLDLVASICASIKVTSRYGYQLFLGHFILVLGSLSVYFCFCVTSRYLCQSISSVSVCLCLSLPSKSIFHLESSNHCLLKSILSQFISFPRIRNIIISKVKATHYVNFLPPSFQPSFRNEHPVDTFFGRSVIQCEGVQRACACIRSRSASVERAAIKIRRRKMENGKSPGSDICMSS